MNPQPLNAIKLRASIRAAALLGLLLTPLSSFGYAMPTPHQAASLVDDSLRGTNDVAPAALPNKENTAPSLQVIGVYTTFLPLIMTPEHLTSDQLIDRALASGAINAETALIYKVYAAFSDSRLPTQYKGDDSQVRETHIVSEVRTQFTHLSPAAQAILEPFLLPPSAPGSWVELPTISAQSNTLETRQQPVSAAAAIEWGIVSNAGSPVKVWYEKRYPGDDAKARTVANAMDTDIWPNLTSLMGSAHIPLSDAGYQNNGGDGRFDIYLVHIAGNRTVPYLHACDQPITPAYVLLDSRQADLLPMAAHEFMHAILFTYKTGWCDEYRWLNEATATWAEDRVYPKKNSEHQFAPAYLAKPEEPLFSTRLDKGYRAYLFLFFLTHRLGQPGLIKTIWDNTVSSDSLESINDAIPGGFQEQWPRFALANWNRDPVLSYDGDKLYAGATAKTINLALNGASSHTELLQEEIKVKPLAATYYHLVFIDDNISSVRFQNPFTDAPTASVQALIRYQGKPTWEAPEDWTKSYRKYFCRDRRDERIEELVLIFSNSEWQDRDWTGALQPDWDPRLEISNIGCWKWTGTTSYTGHYNYGLNYSVTSDVVLQSMRPQYVRTSGEAEVFFVVGGTAQWSIWGTDMPGCSGSGSGSNPLFDPGDPYWFDTAAHELYLSLWHGSGDGADGRYTGAFPFVGDARVLFTCVTLDPPPYYTYYIYWGDGLVFAVDPVWSGREFSVNADGRTMDGDYTTNINGASLTEHFHWHFEAQRQP